MIQAMNRLLIQLQRFREWFTVTVPIMLYPGFSRSVPLLVQNTLPTLVVGAGVSAAQDFHVNDLTIPLLVLSDIM
jgi:hypothetical protein